MSTKTKNCKPAKTRDCAHWLNRLVRRIFWKRELALMEFRIMKVEWERDGAKSDAIAYKECYDENRKILAEQRRLIRDLRFKLSEATKAERQRKLDLP